MKRASLVCLGAGGPVAVAFLRLLLPYYRSADNADSARLVLDHPGRQSVVLWLGLIAMLTLVPGLYVAREALPPGRLRSWSVGLTLVGYLCLPVLLVSDHVLWAAADLDLGPDVTGRLLDNLHPTADIAAGLFVIAHVVGTTLIGLLCLRSRVLPPVVAWALLFSQPLHFVTTVLLGLSWLDFIAWSLTGVAMGWLAAVAHRTATPDLSALRNEPVLRHG